MDVMQSFAAGAQAVTSAEQSAQDYQSLIGSKQDLKTAYEESSIDQQTGIRSTPDPFKVNSLAATMAAKRGDLKSFELFNKQAQEYRKGNLDAQKKELEIKNDQIEKAEQQLQMMETPEDALKEVMSDKSPLPMPERLQLVKQLAAFKDNPAGFKKWKEDHLKSHLTAKEFLHARIEELTLEETERYHRSETARKAEKDKKDANRQVIKDLKDAAKEKRILDKDAIKEQQDIEKHDDALDFKIIEAENHADSLMKDANKIKDPDVRSKELKRIKDQLKERKALLEGKKKGKPKEPPKVEYNTDVEIKAAFKSGKITRDQAKKLLKEHGYNE